MTEREGYIALNCIQGIGIATTRRLIEALGSVSAIFDASEADLLSVEEIGAARARVLIRGLRESRWDGELAQAERQGVRLVTLADEDYPKLLQQIADPPLVLYVQGDVNRLSLPGVAVVGTRHPTIYGADVAERFGFGLAEAGYVVFSGFAEGVDSRAHRGALKALGGRTVGVLGSALDRLYPASNMALAEEVVGAGGALVSEYPFGRSADRQTFPMRNRIISGLALGVLVVEAPAGSGTLLTVDQALDQGRPVMAIPGRIDVPQAEGSLSVIRAGGQLVRHVQDVLDELQLLPGFYAGRARSASAATSGVAERLEVRPPLELSDAESKILACLSMEGTHVDAVIASSGLGARVVASGLVALELKKVVRRLPGGMVGLV